MRLSEQQVQDFAALYEKKYGVVLSTQEAFDIASRFIKLIGVVESNVVTSTNQNAHGDRREVSN